MSFFFFTPCLPCVSLQRSWCHLRHLPSGVSEHLCPRQPRKRSHPPGLQVQVRHRLQQTLGSQAPHRHQGRAQDLRLHSLLRQVHSEGQAQGSLPPLPQGHGRGIASSVQRTGVEASRCCFSSPSGPCPLGCSPVWTGSDSCIRFSASSCSCSCRTVYLVTHDVHRAAARQLLGGLLRPS